MKTTISGFIVWHKYGWEETPSYEFCMNDMKGRGPEWVVIATHEFEVEIPDDFDPRPKQIAALREAKQAVFADAQEKANNIEEQIQRLLCLEHKPEVIEEEGAPF